MLTKENLVEKINRLPAELLKDPDETFTMHIPSDYRIIQWMYGML